MKTLLIVFFSIFFLGCASAPPQNKRDACLILSEKEEWLYPLWKASKKWGIPKYTILSIIYHESKFVHDAKPPRKRFLGIELFWTRISSAYGFSQALDGTWEEYKNETGNWGAERTDFDDSVDFIGWYLNRSVKTLGISPRNAYELYLVYHQGVSGFKRRAYLKKPRIMSYAKKVQRTALVYKEQIRTCS